MLYRREPAARERFGAQVYKTGNSPVFQSIFWRDGEHRMPSSILEPDENWRRQTAKLEFQRGWFSFGYKSEIRTFEAGDKSPMCGGSIGEEECVWELRLDWSKQGGKMFSLKNEIPPCGREDRSGQ
ncbi:hypothetical protein AVEN_144573-1 [Araneus ventricosus]|uniref:Uncharacterized protein n=1 Tax=Araneus ventricosus TaxID=182803 RepID=A0A4Y2BY00_ARAVE|nr:hypothetical protein AVEN_144573-1 [Araneus ventricosus]